MGTTTITVPIIFALSVVMIMSGRGGGNFYVAALVLLGIPMLTASTTSQFILLASALSGAVIFGKAKTLSWRLVLFFGGLNASMAFLGGFEARLFSGVTLKVALSILLFIAGVAMLLPEKQGRKVADPRVGELPSRWQQVPTDRLVATFCSSVTRAVVAWVYLRLRGLENVRILDARYGELAEELVPGKVYKRIKAQ